jgi:hypothetical protein
VDDEAAADPEDANATDAAADVCGRDAPEELPLEPVWSFMVVLYRGKYSIVGNTVDSSTFFSNAFVGNSAAIHTR